MKNIDLSIVVPVYNNFNFTKACLSDLAKLPDNHEIVLVDNGSDDETMDYDFNGKIKFESRFKKIRNQTNAGFAKACNLGYSLSSGNNVMFLNNDIRVRDKLSSWTSPIIDAAKNDKLVGPTAGLLDVNLNFMCETDKVEQGNSYMSGWCLTANKDTWKRLTLPQYDGPFSEEFGLAYFEDTDLSFRAKEIGISFEIVQIPVVHFGRMTGKKLDLTGLYTNAKTIFKAKWLKK